MLLAERIKKKSAPGKFYKGTFHNIAYFNKKGLYYIKQKKIKDEKKDDVKRHTFSYKSGGKNKSIEFYNYFEHLKKHVFQWKDGFISYEVKL